LEVKRVVRVLADISGYTCFIKVHTMSLLHAGATIGELLEAANWPQRPKYRVAEAAAHAAALTYST
jgi:hypothetical protein